MHVTFGDIASAWQSEQVAYRLPPSCKAYRKRAFVCSCFVRRFSLLSLIAMLLKTCRTTALCLGGVRQGRVSCELQNTITLSLLRHSLFFCPDTTAHQSCAGHCQMKYIYFRVNGGTIATIHFLLIRSTDVHIVSGVISDSNLIPL